MLDIERIVGFAAISFVLMLILPVLALIGLAIPYAILRLREGRGEHDPQVGLKAGLHYFISLSMILMLIGLNIIFADLFTREDRNDRRIMGEMGRMDRWNGRIDQPVDTAPMRIGGAFLASGGLFLVIHGVLLIYTNDSKYRAARRTFIGARVAIHGVVILVAVLLLFVMLFMENVDVKSMKPLWATLLVWVPSWIIHLALLIAGTPRKLDRPQLDFENR